MAWVSLCDISELNEGFGKYVEIDGFHLAVFLSEGAVYAMDNTCPHAGASLAGGWVEQGCAVCPRHSWSFHLENGQMRGIPGVKISTYPIRLLPRDGNPVLVQADLPLF